MADSGATKINKIHDKRQTTTYLFQPQQDKRLSQYPVTRAYLSASRYQYNPAFKNIGRTIQQIKPPPPSSTFVASPYVQTFKPQPRGHYTQSYYYPHRTYYRDWSRKVLEAGNYARKWQTARKQNFHFRNQKTNKGNVGIKLFVAGINKNGNVRGKWIGQNYLQKPNNQKDQQFLQNKPPQQNAAPSIAYASTNVNIGLPNNNPSDPELKTQPVTNLPSHSYNQHSQAQENITPISSDANSGEVKLGAKNLQLQTQISSSLGDKASTTNANSNGAILSDNLGGAVLGPNAHSLLQSATLQQAPVTGASGIHQGGVGPLASTNQLPKTDSLQKYATLKTGESVNKKLPSYDIPRQRQGENILFSNNQHPINKTPVNLESNKNSLPRKNTSFSQPSANLSATFQPNAKAANTPVIGQENHENLPGTAAGVSKIPSVIPQKKTSQPAKNLALDPANVDKAIAQKLNAELASVSASRSQSRAVFSQPSASTATPNKVASRINAPGKINPNQTPFNRELALKNILFPPPAAMSNQPSGRPSQDFPNTVQKNVSPQQIVPSFPAFRYDANLPATGQSGSNSYRRNNIPHPASMARKSLVPQLNPVPYKSSFPLMLHKISPYFKMKRNLKQMDSGQARARKRFLELQSKCALKCFRSFVSS